MIDVCNIQVMKPLLASHGFHFSKAKGQNFLIAPWVPRQIAEDAGVDGTAGVLEIGPGIGPLTQQLALRAAKVCAVEVDRRLEPILAQTVGEFDNLQILWNDVLKMDVKALVEKEFPGLRPMACANLPYYITSPILSALLEAECFESVTVMVQKEVALRIGAQPGSADYSAFTGSGTICTAPDPVRCAGPLLPSPAQGDQRRDPTQGTQGAAVADRRSGGVLPGGACQLCHAPQDAAKRIWHPVSQSSARPAQRRSWSRWACPPMSGERRWISLPLRLSPMRS